MRGLLYVPMMELVLGIVIGVAVVLLVSAWIGKRAQAEAGSVRSSPAPSPASLGADARRAPAPGVPTRLSSDGRLAVVGESHYQPALRAVVGTRDVQGFEKAMTTTAALIAEPDNKYDRNAVRVDIDGRPVGHLAREDAVRYQPPLLDLQRSGRYGWCPASICCGEDRIYGVWLQVSAPDRFLPVNSSDGLHMLQADRQVTVTREENHQDVLTEVAKLGRGAEVISVFASLDVCEIDKGKHKGGRGVEVLIDDRRVGEPTKRLSALDRGVSLIV